MRKLLAAALVLALLLTVAASCGSSDNGVPAEIPRISVEEVKAKLDAGSNIAIVDARSKREYEQSHIAGAISIPLQEITQRYSELYRYDEIVIYCT